ncbi:MAG: SDR family NAD(P)-dependent oxidoreductase [Actinomycetota bacterium]
MKIQGRTALVTGGASGLGLAVVREVSRAGGFATILDLPDSKGAEAAKALGFRARFTAADVTSEEEVSTAIQQTVEVFGGVHILVNCAGVATPGRVLDKNGIPLPLDRFSEVVWTNLVGTYNVLRLAAAQMARQALDGEERGVIVNTASVAAFDGQIGQNAYAASKGGVAAMTLPLARDLAGIGVRVVTIAPGIFDTPMLAGLPEDRREGLAAMLPHPRRLGKPEEFAALVTAIVENPMLNGEVIRLDGALRMPPR